MSQSQTSVSDEQISSEDYEHMKELAGWIQSNEHLAKIIRDAEPHLRRSVYKLLKPHLTFKAKPYFILSKAWTN